MQPVDSNTIAEHHVAVPASDPGLNGANPMNKSWTIVDCGHALYHRKQLLLSVAACGVLIAAFAGAMQTPMYQSRASIQIQGLNDNFLSLRDIYPTAAPGPDNAVYIQTQAEMLRQDALLEEVVRKLHLDERRDFNPAWRAVAAPNASRALDELKKHVQIVPTRGSSIIQIVAEASDPQLAADLANTLAQTFIDQSIETRQYSARQTQASLTLQRDAIRKTLLQSEVDLEAMGRGSSSTVVRNELRREFDANRRFYQVLSQRVDEARIASGMNQSNVRLVGAARPPARPFKPNTALNISIGAIAGLIFGIGLVMLREQTSSALRIPGDSGAWLSIPELGAIPKAESRRFATFGSGQRAPAIPVERVSFEQSSSGLCESFRAATASILALESKGDHPRVLVVTSSRPGEGKTTVASNLAVSLADAGGKVLLIDGDLRRPRLHKVFDQANSWGLSDLLREKNAIEDVPIETLVKKTNIPKLHLLTGGTSAENIFALLWSSRM